MVLVWPDPRNTPRAARGRPRRSARKAPSSSAATIFRYRARSRRPRSRGAPAGGRGRRLADQRGDGVAVDLKRLICFFSSRRGVRGSALSSPPGGYGPGAAQTAAASQRTDSCVISRGPNACVTSRASPPPLSKTSACLLVSYRTLAKLITKQLRAVYLRKLCAVQDLSSSTKLSSCPRL